MSEVPKGAIAKNLLLCTGVFYLSKWVVLPLALGFGKLTQGIIYRGDFQGTVLMPLVLHVPIALVAAGAGASVLWLVDSARPLRWVIFSALLYGSFGLLGYHWAHRPLLHDRVFQTVGALFPAITCVLGGIMAIRRRAVIPAPSSSN